MIGRALLWFLLASAPAHATILAASGFDGANQSSTNTQPLEMGAAVGGQTTTQAFIQTTVACKTTNGCDDSSRWAAKIVPGANASAAFQWATCPGCATNQAFATPQIDSRHHFSVLVTTLPGVATEKILGCALESDGSVGCCATVDSNGNVGLRYKDSVNTPWGFTTTTPLATVNRCSATKYLGCTTASDCPTSGETCDTCNTSTGANCHWTSIQVGERVNGASEVICSLKVDGTSIFDSHSHIVSDASVAKVINFIFGQASVTDTGLTNGTMVDFIDNTVSDGGSGTDAHDLGRAYVYRLTPQTVAQTQWSTDNCSNNPITCLGDYDTGSFLYNADNTNNALFSNKASTTESFTVLQPTVSLPSSAKILAVDVAAFGRTNSAAGTYAFALGLLGCPSGVCTAGIGPIWSLANDTTIRQLTRFAKDLSPVPGQSDWAPLLNDIGFELVTGSANNSNVRVGAAVVYAVATRGGIAEAPTLLDHNAGTDDGFVTIFGIGDSTLGGTLAQSCVGGDNANQLCSQDTCCEWDTVANGGFCDTPAGGCGTALSTDANASCRTCPLHRDNFNHTGIPCTVDADCTLSCGANNKCVFNGEDTTIACTSGADCALGSCPAAGSSRCVASCPGGTCPSTGSGWLSQINTPGSTYFTPVDYLVRCYQGGESTGTMYSQRFSNHVAGHGITKVSFGTGICEAIVGTGKCTCTSDADCGGGASSCNLGSGLCTSGTPYSTCTLSTDCVNNNSFCQFPAPDYIVTVEGYNDQHPYGFIINAETNTMGATDPNCETPAALGLAGTVDANSPRYQCPQVQTSPDSKDCAKTACTTDTDCSGISPTSVCDGVYMTGSFQGQLCNKTAFGAGNCTVFQPTCSQTSDCVSTTGAYTLACSLKQPYNNPLTMAGVCTCTADGNCPTGYICIGVGGAQRCTKTCTGLSDTTTCGTGSSCVDSGSSRFVCRGACQCTCDAISCSADADCPARTVTLPFAGFGSRSFQATCNPSRGKCANCGLVRGSDPGLLAGPCSCSGNGDCGGGGVCGSLKVCTSGDSTHLNCLRDSSCASGQRCMAKWRQYGQYHGHWTEAERVAVSMQQYINGLSESDGRPVLLFSGLPLPNGTTQAGSVVSFITDGSGYGTFGDREYYASVYQSMLSVVPSRHVVKEDFFDTTKTYTANHTDQVHYSFTGSVQVGQAVAQYLNRLNVCLQADGITPQKYCRAPNGIFDRTGGTDSNGACTADSDCSTGHVCLRKPCSSCSCTSGADCTSGTCTSGFCTGGALTRIQCRNSSQCGGGFSCQQTAIACPNASDSCGPD